MNGSSLPTKLLKDGVTSIIKAKKERNTTDDEAALDNSKTLYAIYNELIRMFSDLSTHV